MPFVETLESYSRALYLPLRGYIRRPFQFATESIRDHVPKGLWSMRRAMEHTIRGSSRLIGPLDGFQLGLASDPGSSSGSANSIVNGMTSSGSSITQGSVGGSSVSGSAGTAIGANSGAGAGTGAKILQSQPSMIHFFTSPYFLLLCFMSIVLNRINAIVAPRNPHPLKLSVRFALKIPAFYLLMKSALITIALLIQDQPSMPFAWLFSDLKTTYNESHALWLSFIAMGVTCTSDSFIANLHSTVASEQTTNMLEWAVQFHFTPSGRDILIISLIHVCQLLTLQFLSLSSRGKNYRLIVTTFWAMLDLSHFAHAIYYRTNTYPSLQMLSRLPEVVVLLMVCISMVLHALTYIVTGGNIRRQMFEPRAMPSMDEEYTLAVFKLGRACMEATRGVGFRNEVDSVILPFGTILDMRQSGKSRSTLRGSSGDRSQGGQSAFSLLSGSGNANRTIPSGFSNEMTDAVETPGQRQQISRRRNRMIAMKAFFQSSANLIIELAYGTYNRIVPVRYRRTRRATRTELGTRMTVQDFIHLRATIEFALERARHSRGQKAQSPQAEGYRQMVPLDEEEEEELYSEFLSRDLTASDDEDDDLDVDYVVQGESEEEDEIEIEDEDALLVRHEQKSGVDESDSYGIRRRIHSHDGSDADDDDIINDPGHEVAEQGSAWGSWSSLQDFFLDTSFMSIFLSSRLQDTPLTRSQYRLTMSGAREFQQESIQCRDEGGSSSGTGSSGVLSSRNKGRSNDSDTKVLLTVLNRYRKSVVDKSSPDVLSTGSPGSMFPPPLTQPSSAPEDSTLPGDLSSALVAEVMSKDSPRSTFLELSSQSDSVDTL
ncbi:hypothetical protein BGZ80_011490 [Entomortierella chlamydospora]|uniref:Uncharacterized protein n=1 Tax=Entomortierella chlamydospora TaxID=101097 RepID=A0A9P6T3Q6_9FUNG|nr:hypothetical protein BGZ80_011490 [Entomortierella chlamydospora]